MIALPTLFAAAVACTGCSGIPVASGVYKDEAEREYRISTKGGSALSVVGEGELCLRFWRKKEPKISNDVELLSGQTCENKTFGDLDWRAGFSHKTPGRIILYPPGAFIDETVEPIEISLAR